jgi:putative Holliday junction resolvase
MSAPSALPGERIAGIDFGSVRIGVALADTGLGIATPHDNYTRRSPVLDAAYFRQLVERERIGRFVVGLPVHLDGRESAKSAEARRFGQWLQETSGVPVEYFDERFTTTEAEALLLEAGLSKKARRARLDKLAAQIMLTAYLESRTRQPGPPSGLED